MKSGSFPRPVSLGGRAVGWPEDEVEKAQEALIKAAEAKREREWGGARCWTFAEFRVGHSFAAARRAAAPTDRFAAAAP